MICNLTIDASVTGSSVVWRRSSRSPGWRRRSRRVGSDRLGYLSWLWSWAGWQRWCGFVLIRSFRRILWCRRCPNRSRNGCFSLVHDTRQCRCWALLNWTSWRFRRGFGLVFFPGLGRPLWKTWCCRLFRRCLCFVSNFDVICWRKAIFTIKSY